MRSKFVDHSKRNVVNIIEGPVWSSKKKENLHFDIDKDIHRSFKNQEENAYRHDLDLLIISH